MESCLLIERKFELIAERVVCGVVVCVCEFILSRYTYASLCVLNAVESICMCCSVFFFAGLLIDADTKKSHDKKNISKM